MIAVLRQFGAVTLFLFSTLAACVPALARPGAIVRQIYNSGARSLVIIMLSGLVVGMIMAWLSPTCWRASAVNPRWGWPQASRC